MVFKSQKSCDSSGQIISGPLILKPQVFKDERGFFLESWNNNEWQNIMQKNKQQSYLFVQDNHSKSSIGVLRGLHYQLNPFAQGKLVRCISGEIYDVAVDIRTKSPSFGKYIGLFLSAENHLQLWIPPGFAHGFLTISNYAEILYKTTNFWHKDYERSIIWNDPLININWPNKLINNNEIVISSRDSKASLLSSLNYEDLL